MCDWEIVLGHLPGQFVEGTGYLLKRNGTREQLQWHRMCPKIRLGVVPVNSKCYL